MSRFEVSDVLWDRFSRCIRPRADTHRFGGGRPPADDRRCLSAILFVLRTGCQWNALNATGICPSSTAHDRLRRWVGDGTFGRFFHGGLLEYDELVGIDRDFLSADGGMNKSPLGGKGTGPNPTDRAKKGAKRGLLVEGRGVPLSVAVDGANVPDVCLLGPTPDGLDELPVRRPGASKTKPQGLCLDKGYDYPVVRELCRAFDLVPHVRPRGEEAKDVKRKRGRKPRRWVVGRTLGWLNRFRRLLIRWEKDDAYHVGFLHLAFGIIAYRCAGLFGLGS